MSTSSVDVSRINDLPFNISQDHTHMGSVMPTGNYGQHHDHSQSGSSGLMQTHQAPSNPGQSLPSTPSTFTFPHANPRIPVSPQHPDAKSM